MRLSVGVQARRHVGSSAQSFTVSWEAPDIVPIEEGDD